MRRILGIVAGFVALMIIGAGCNTSGCLDNQSSIPLAGFYNSATGAAISIDSVNIGGVDAPNDSLLLAMGTSASQVYLPLRFSKDVTSFYIQYDTLGLWADTITMAYTALPYFASEECGAMYRYTINRLTYTTLLIDSVTLVDSLITNADIERIKIYFRVEEADEEEE
ncbi:MAG: DUF6452 family protein [Bacteroidales bacterium]|nr:DUF6452 family protein [Bacteroidales bacterium]MCD8395379.1 DUF6452 family protein [Bacteroidales bacterium]